MENKIEKLRLIISSNQELNGYLEAIQENWNEAEFNNYVTTILNDFEHFNDLQVRPAFYTELELLFSKYDKDNQYGQQN